MLSSSAYSSSYYTVSASALGRGVLNSDTNSFKNNRVTPLLNSLSCRFPQTNSCEKLGWAASNVKFNSIGIHFDCRRCLHGGQRRRGVFCFQKSWSNETSAQQNAVQFNSKQGGDTEMIYTVGQPSVPPFLRLNGADQAFLLLAFIACTTTGALVSLIITAIPTLNAMARAASSLEKLADTAREELPGTMAAIRLSGMEISDLTLELSDLSQEITEGVRKSAQAVRAAEVGIRRIGGLASSRAISMLEERANLPMVTVKPAIASAADATSHTVQRAIRALSHIISSMKRGNKLERWQGN